jgi:phosphate:Na+ symporter
MNPILVSILNLLAGVGVFIAGMNMMSEGLERSTGSGMKRLFSRISDNRFAGVGIGAAVTALIQSSSATSVMAIGLVNAGVMTLVQAASIIMGANIGTTVTGLIVSLSALDVSLFASCLAFVGVMMTFLKNEKVKRIGGALAGLGLLFVGLEAMSGAFKNDSIKSFFADIFVAIDFPLLLIICGVLFTALIQSSSAATGLVIIMVGTGAITVESALFIILGSNIGTCVTALIAAIGTSVNAKRTAIIHLSFNIIGTFFFTILLWIFANPIVKLLGRIFENPQMQIAWFHVAFNVTTTILLLPFIRQLVAFATRLVRDKKSEEEKRQLRFVDDRLLKTPPIALLQVKREIGYMAALAEQNLHKSYESLWSHADRYAAEIAENEAIIDFTNKSLTKFLIRLSSVVDPGDEKAIGAYFHVLNDLERVGDHAENFHEIGVQMKDEELSFSEQALLELRGMADKAGQMFAIARNAFENGNRARLGELTALEEEIDGLKRTLSAQHFARLSEGSCRLELSAYFSSTVAGLERVADHLVNVGYSIVDPTGSESSLEKA